MQEKESIMVVRCELKLPSLRITVRHHSASLVMPNSYPHDRIFNQDLTIIKISYTLFDIGKNIFGLSTKTLFRVQGTVKGARRRGRQKKRWEGNIKEWMGMGFEDSLRAAEDREGWKGIVATSSVVPRRPPRLRD